MSMRTSWSAVRRLPGRDRWTLVEAAALLPAASVGLKLIGLRGCQNVLAVLAPGGPFATPDNAADSVPSTARMVRIAATRGLWKASCLPRSLVLAYLLRRRRIDARVRIGVRRQNGNLEAHAWVEVDGGVVNDRSDVHEQFAPFSQLDAASAGHTLRSP
jgi:hypothetical protein